MARAMTGRLARAAALALAASAGAAAPAAAETLVGTNVDNRVIVGFRVAADALDPWLPAGWAAVPFPGGPFAGGNLLLVLIDRKLQLDAEGAPATPPNSRYAVFAGLGQDTGGDAVRLYVYRILASDPAPDPYSNSVAATVARETTTDGPANGARQRLEEWEIESGEDTEVGIELRFETGTRSWGPAEANPYSNTEIGFSRIYRYDQLVDVVMSEALGRPLAGSFEYEIEGPELSPIFDGTESVVGILDVPVYARQVFLP